MMPPAFYDPNSADEQPIPLPSAPPISLGPNIVLQPPLTRRGSGPGLFLILPPLEVLSAASRPTKPLDPEPIQKWAEEGFVVVGITLANDSQSPSVANSVAQGIDALSSRLEVDIQDKFGLIVYDAQLLSTVLSEISQDPRFVCVAAYGAISKPLSTSLPLLNHATGRPGTPHATPSITTHRYTALSPFFVLPHVSEYEPGSAAVAHSRTLVFLRRWIGGPTFDLEAIWDEHTYFEFEVRSVAKTMATMVAEPYVNHVPTMTGGVGRKDLTAFYRDHFIFANPADTTIQLVSRTVGPDRIIDEFVYHLTHDKVVDYLLPGVPPTGKKLAIPMMAVVNIRGDRLYNEHIWWDQGTALFQAGVLPTHVPYPTPDGNHMLRLPVAGAESARMLVDETDGTSNEMFGSEWGLQA